ncbi:MAG TPA: hypothetical protein VE650_19360 [Acetobacteraceae bacterium]|nr:hypothetical protein [Acetobacteraceae bacterium]
MKLRLLFAALATCIGLGCGFARAGAAINPCEAPDEASGVITSLPHVAAALHPGSTLNVLAVGSATLFGPEASLLPSVNGAAHNTVSAPQLIRTEPSDLAFPRQMAKALEVAVPGATVKVTVRGGRGLTAADMLGLMQSALAGGTYQLVLWQTGTVEAVRNVPPASSRKRSRKVPPLCTTPMRT